MVNLSKIWGGGEKWFLTVGSELQTRGLDVKWLVYPQSPLEQKLSIENKDFRSISLRFLNFPFRMVSLIRIIRQLDPEIIILNASHELKTVGLVASGLRVHQVIFRRGVSFAISQNFFNKWIIRNVVTGFIANSQATFQSFLTSFPAIATKPHISLNNGIDFREWESPGDIVPQKGRIAMVARLSREKGIERAIMAMEVVVKEVPRAQLMIMGEGDAREELEQLVLEKGLTGHVVFHGFNQRVKELLATCELFVFTPRWGEGTSIALIEAMALKLPCVVMDTPAMREVVIDGETGFVVPDEDIMKLARRIIQLLEDHELREQMGLKSQERAFRHFDIQVLADRLAYWLLYEI